MVETLSSTGATTDPLLTPPAGLVKRRRPLPTGRAALGGLLVALAAVGTFAAASGAAKDTRQAYVVARADLPIGHRITESDLAVGRMDLPDFLRERAFAEATELVGHVVRDPVARGELLHRSDVTEAPDPNARQISFPIDPARALGGALRPGDAVDVLATVDDATTVVAHARVAAVREKGTLAGAGHLTVTLDVATAELAVAIAHAVDAGHVTLARTAP